PQGIAWEAYRTLGEAPTFGVSRAARAAGPNAGAPACCAPAHGQPAGAPTQSACC
ncbi:ArsI/CadI family heavy metal resistance metalloenzyme, partial [Burkholderia pseudomallei]